jgi:pilus assembly protein Flp/PilA
MSEVLLKFYVKMQSVKHALVHDERGQDLVEYALVVALIALGATLSMKSLANSISNAFSSVGAKLAGYTT